MPVTIKGIRVEHINVSRDSEESGGYKLSTTYSLISSLDRVLAKQEVGGYNGLKVEISPETRRALDSLMASYKTDIEAVLGLEAN